MGCRDRWNDFRAWHHVEASVFLMPSRTSSLFLMIWLCTIAHRRGNPTALMSFSWKPHGITSRESVLKRCDRQRRSRFQARETPPQRPTDRRLRANLRAFATTSRLASAHEGRIAVISMKSQTKEKAEARKANPGPNQEALVVLCLLDLGIKCVSFGRQVSASVAMNVLSNTHQSLQLHLLKMTSVERARTRRRRTRRRTRTRRRATAPGRQAEVPIPRGAHRVSRTKGENHLPLARLQFAWCALWWWLQWLTLRPVLIACRKASPLRSFSTSILPCQLHPTQSHFFMWGQRWNLRSSHWAWLQFESMPCQAQNSQSSLHRKGWS